MVGNVLPPYVAERRPGRRMQRLHEVPNGHASLSSITSRQYASTDVVKQAGDGLLRDPRLDLDGDDAALFSAGR